ncbi:MAG: VanZ family protein [Gemmatimonadales bacterium]
MSAKAGPGADSGPRTEGRRAGRYIAVLGALFIAALTLMPAPPDDRVGAPPMSHWCVVCGQLGGVDVILNVLLFMPFGFGMRTAGLSRRRALLIAFAVTCTVEFLQLTVITGRDATIGDILMNSLGGAIGILLADSWRALVMPAPAVARRLRILGSLGWLGIWGLSALVLQGSLPNTTWFAQVPSQGSYQEDFPGSVVGATLNGVTLHDGPIPNGGALRELVLRSGSTLDAVAVTGHGTTAIAPIAVIVDNFHTEILMVGQDGTDLVLRALLSAPGFRLRPPMIRLPGILATPGDTVRIAAGFRDSRFHLETVIRNRRVERVVSVSPSWGWSFLLPFEYAMGPETTPLTALWIAGLLAPLAYWASRESRRPIGALAFIGGIVVLGLASVPYAARLDPVRWSEWAAACGGVALGFTAGRWSKRLG